MEKPLTPWIEPGKWDAAADVIECPACGGQPITITLSDPERTVQCHGWNCPLDDGRLSDSDA